MKPFALICAAALIWPAAVVAGEDAAAGTLVDFRVEVQRKVPNDLGRAVLYVELSGPDSGDVARRVKARLAEGLALAKAQRGVAVHSGGTQTWPVYAKSGGAIEAWRMRSEIVLESAEAAALSAAVGQLQKTMAVARIGFQPAPETRRAAEDAAELEAIQRFRDKAERVAAAFRQSYRIRRMTLSAAGGQPPMPMLRMASAEGAAMPLEAGDSMVMVAVDGQIELPAATK